MVIDSITLRDPQPCLHAGWSVSFYISMMNVLQLCTLRGNVLLTSLKSCAEQITATIYHDLTTVTANVGNILIRKEGHNKIQFENCLCKIFRK